MDIKIIFSIIATVLGIIGFVPYILDIFSFKTKPHAYTWFIWMITQTTAVLGIWSGGGSWGALNLTVGTFFVFIVFLFSLKYGTRNITLSDTIVLIFALLAIVVWWQMDKPVWAVIMVSIIDVSGYIPSLRKSYVEPWSETLSSWMIFSASNVFALLALYEYNLLTVIYLLSITLANILLFLFCVVRRLSVAKPLSRNV